MSNVLVSDADRIKLIREVDTLDVSKEEAPGVKPRPIRKRGFWRAFKRKELWAFHSYIDLKYKDAFDRLVKKCAKTYMIPNVAPNTVYLVYPT